MRCLRDNQLESSSSAAEENQYVEEEEEEEDESVGEDGEEERENFCEIQDRRPEVESELTRLSRLEEEAGALPEDLLK